MLLWLDRPWNPSAKVKESQKIRPSTTSNCPIVEQVCPMRAVASPGQAGAQFRLNQYTADSW